MKKSTLFLHLLSLTFIQNYAIKIVCTPDNLPDYATLCTVGLRQEKRKVQAFKKELPLINKIPSKKAEIEKKLENIKEDLENLQKAKFLNFKDTFKIDNGIWEDCTNIATQKYNLDVMRSSTLSRGTHDQHMPTSVIDILKKELYNNSLDPKNFVISLGEDNIDILKLPIFEDTIPAINSNWNHKFCNSLGKIVIPAHFKNANEEDQQAWCMIAAYTLSLKKYEDIFLQMLLTYKESHNLNFTQTDLPTFCNDVAAHIALISKKNAHMMLKHRSKFVEVGASSNDYLLLAKIVRYWDMLALLESKRNDFCDFSSTFNDALN